MGGTGTIQGPIAPTASRKYITLVVETPVVEKYTTPISLGLHQKH